jgi:hypothetical protein
MDSMCNTAPRICTRCQDNPRLPKQRWCRECLTAAQRVRRAAQPVAQAEAPSRPVTHAPILQETPPLRTDTYQPAAESPPQCHEIDTARRAYSKAQQEYRVATRRPWPRLPPTPTLKVHHLWRQVERTKRRLATVTTPAPC